MAVYACTFLSPADSQKLQGIDPAITAAGLAAGATGAKTFVAPLLYRVDTGGADWLAGLRARGDVQLNFAITADGTILPPSKLANLAAAAAPVFMPITITLPVPTLGANAAGENTLTQWPPDWAGLSHPDTRGELAPRLRPSLDFSVSAMRARPADLPAGSASDGSGVILGVVDWGCDFAHPAFRRLDGTTRLTLLWNLNGRAPSGTLGLGRPMLDGALSGVVFDASSINTALVAADPYAALGYDPLANSYAPPPADMVEIVHGTHVLDTAGGSRLAARGVAPGAELMFVHLRPNSLKDDNSQGENIRHANGGDVVAASCAILYEAQQRNVPCVLNLSMGNNAGPHDGSSVVERMLDAMASRPGRALIVPAGNNQAANLHASGTVRVAQPRTMRWNFTETDTTPNTIDLWYESGSDIPTLNIMLIAPDGTAMGQGEPGQGLLLSRDGQQIGSLLSETRPPPDIRDTWLHHVRIEVMPSGADESWRVTASTDVSVDINFNAWIDRSDVFVASQSHFASDDADSEFTLDSLSCGYHTICVGSCYQAAPDQRASGFSSLGTTRDGRQKPDVAAPGEKVRAACAKGSFVAMTGTSVSAPHVAGVAALLLQARPNATAGNLRQWIIGSTQLPTATPTAKATAGQAAARTWDPCLGFGRIDAAAALRAAIQGNTP